MGAGPHRIDAVPRKVVMPIARVEAREVSPELDLDITFTDAHLVLDFVGLDSLQCR
jgi:hypothetical protein